MTVSCNCQDYDGSGQIGNLREKSFDQIFSDKKAQFFRNMLFHGKMPISVCKSCVEVTPADRADPDRYLNRYQLPHYGIMVENTVMCNLRCLCCRRSELLAIRRRNRMSLDDVELVAQLILDNNIKSIAYFNLGEPFLSQSIHDEISIIRKYNPTLLVTCSTNGSQGYTF